MAFLETENEDQLLADHGAPRPDVIGGEDAEFFNGQTLEDAFDVLRVDVFSLFGDNHVFLAAEELQMAGRIDAAKIAGQEPTVHDGFCGEFGIVKVTGHHRFATDGELSNAVGIGVDDADLPALKRLPHPVLPRCPPALPPNPAASPRLPPGG